MLVRLPRRHDRMDRSGGCSSAGHAERGRPSPVVEPVEDVCASIATVAHGGADPRQATGVGEQRVWRRRGLTVPEYRRLVGTTRHRHRQRPPLCASCRGRRHARIARLHRGRRRQPGRAHPVRSHLRYRLARPTARPSGGHHARVRQRGLSVPGCQELCRALRCRARRRGPPHHVARAGDDRLLRARPGRQGKLVQRSCGSAPRRGGRGRRIDPTSVRADDHDVHGRLRLADAERTARRVGASGLQPVAAVVHNRGRAAGLGWRRWSASPR